MTSQSMTSPSIQNTVIRLNGAGKSFGATRALADVQVEVLEGTVHAFIGENGAGKSTALGLIAGRLGTDTGTVEVFGTQLTGGNLREARNAGVSVIYQELTIIPHLDAAANVFLGSPISRGSILSKKKMRRRYAELCAEFGVAPVAPGIPAGSLSVAEQQMLEIMRSLVVDPRAILFDEPSSSLAAKEREALYSVIDGLKARGVTIVIVSHNFDEIELLSDRITVFRNGTALFTSARGEKTRDQLVHAMLGDERGSQAMARVLIDQGAGVATRDREDELATPVLEVRDLTVPGVVEGIDFDVKRGDILGIAGLVGAGRSTVLRALAGAEPTATGILRVNGTLVAWPTTVRAARRLGIGLIPEDRKNQGLVLSMSAANNVAMSNLAASSRGGVVSRKTMKSLVSKAASGLNFPVARVGERADSFSGGNQQKLLMARWMYDRPTILLADEPTRGIDVGAKGELLESLRAMAADDVGVIMVSSELEEVLLVSDQVLVISKGKSMGIMKGRGHEIDMEDLLTAAFGLEGNS